MANPEHLKILKQGVEAWNRWREENPDVRPDLSRAKLTEANLLGADLSRANLSRAELRGAKLCEANLSRAFLKEADLFGADLLGADLSRAKLVHANLTGAKLRQTALMRVNFTGADLSAANLILADLTDAVLERAVMVSTKLAGATLTGCRVFGVSAWHLDLSDVKDQTNLRITRERRWHPQGPDEPEITVDNLEVAQFVYLMLHNKKIREVIDTITGKGVLILGRFYDERKAVLDAVRERLRDLNLVPMVFDWDKPTNRDLTETVQLLANMSRFVVADVTDAKSIPQELSHIVPFLPSVPIRPIILAGEYEYSMFEHWTGYNTMLEVFRYDDQAHLIDNIEEALIQPVEEWEAGYDKTKALEEANRTQAQEIAAKDEEIGRLRAELAARDG